jgi:leucyl aminopeptidase
MLRITVSHTQILAQQGAKVFFVQEDHVFKNPEYEKITALFSQLSALEKSVEFTGIAGSTLLFHLSNNNELSHIIFVGLGKKSEHPITIETYRRGLAQAIRLVEQHKIRNLTIQLPPVEWFNITDEYLGQESSIILDMATYHFTTFITDPKKTHTIDRVTLVVPQGRVKAVQKGVQRGSIIADGVELARHWVDLPPAELTPIALADKAKEIAKQVGLKITVFDAELVILEYSTQKKGAPTIAFVGKGITFDSGGLSIKPAQNMETMKEDMSGAAAVIAAMKVIAMLKPEVNVIGITPLAENLPSGKATKPGDIITFYNGKTAEVKNTDAEGRLILADALSYAEKHYDLNAIIDIATLTGACAHALGPFFTGLMSNNQELVSTIENAALLSGDHVWRLPLTDDYKKAISSQVADMSNIGSRQYQAGAITAGHFLGNFVDKTPWAHLDIAGTAFNVPDIPYYRPESATGVGVRLLITVAMDWK